MFHSSIIMKEETEKNCDNDGNITKERKVRFFMQRTDNHRPELPSIIGISQLLREFLNDDDFSIEAEGISIFVQEVQLRKIQQMFTEWNGTNKGSKNIQDFVIYWINHSPHLHVHYSLFDDMQKNGEEIIFKKSDILDRISQKVFQNQKKVDPKQDKQSTKGSNFIMSSKINKPQSNPTELLNKFFIFYSRKQVNSNSIDTFNRYQQECNSLNLTKWMRYCRDIGLSRYKRQLTSKIMKEVFVKHENKDKQLTFQLFQLAVDDLLKILLKGDQTRIKEEGYRMIGIKDQQYFEAKFKEMGEIVPNYCLTTKKPKEKVIESKTSLKYRLDNFKQPKEESKLHQSQISLAKYSTSSLPKIRASKINTQTNEVIRNSFEQSVSEVTNKNINPSIQNSIELYETILSKIQKKKPNKEKEQFLNQLMHEVDDDPYLKRYNDKENIGRYRCIANRIDQRIEKIQQKY